MSFYSTALSGVRTVARWLTGSPIQQPNAAQPALPPPGTQHYAANVNSNGPNGKKPNVQIINDWIVPSWRHPGGSNSHRIVNGHRRCDGKLARGLDGVAGGAGSKEDR